jgi:hypothetical protein
MSRVRRRHLPALIGSAVIAALVASTASFAAPGSTARLLYFKVKSPVARGELAHVVVQGPSGLCGITVSKGTRDMRIRTRTGRDPLAPVSTTEVGDNRVAWQWHLPTNTPLGQWQVRVKCGHAATLQGTFMVTS